MTHVKHRALIECHAKASTAVLYTRSLQQWNYFAHFCCCCGCRVFVLRSSVWIWFDHPGLLILEVILKVIVKNTHSRRVDTLLNYVKINISNGSDITLNSKLKCQNEKVCVLNTAIMNNYRRITQTHAELHRPPPTDVKGEDDKSAT